MTDWSSLTIEELKALVQHTVTDRCHCGGTFVQYFFEGLVLESPCEAPVTYKGGHNYWIVRSGSLSVRKLKLDDLKKL